MKSFDKFIKAAFIVSVTAGVMISGVANASDLVFGNQKICLNFHPASGSIIWMGGKSQNPENGGNNYTSTASIYLVLPDGLKGSTWKTQGSTQSEFLCGGGGVPIPNGIIDDSNYSIPGAINTVAHVSTPNFTTQTLNSQGSNSNITSSLNCGSASNFTLDLVYKLNGTYEIYSPKQVIQVDVYNAGTSPDTIHCTISAQ